MDSYYILTFTVWARCNTRSCQYTVKDMKRALSKFGKPERPKPGKLGSALFFLTVEAITREQANDLRKEVEGAIRLVHKKAPYKFSYKRVDLNKKNPL